MASGETTPLSKTLAPSRVTSRSSCSTFSWCCWTRAIFNRQELEPMSIAAYVCIVWGSFTWGKVDMSAMQDTPLPLTLSSRSDTPGFDPYRCRWPFSGLFADGHPFSRKPGAHRVRGLHGQGEMPLHLALQKRHELRRIFSHGHLG